MAISNLTSAELQNMGYGIAFWIPCYGTLTMGQDNYVFRSAWGPQVNLGWDMRRKDTGYNHLGCMFTQWRELANDFFGDYYPLTHFNPTKKAWMAWQFNLPNKGEGMVQVFRRVNSPCDSMLLRLHGLKPQGRYEERSLHASILRRYSG